MNNVYACILGHNPVLSIAEVLSVFDYKCNVLAQDRDFIIIESEENFPVSPDSLGGIIKIIKIYKITEKEKVIEEGMRTARIFCSEEGISDKLVFGVSVYGKERKIQKELLLGIKNSSTEYIKGKRRFINKRMDRNPAEPLLHTEGIYHTGLELVVCEKNGTYYVGVGLWAQDIDSYAMRDMNRPHRDSRNGMLPPKLAQTMLNLAFEKEYYEPVWDPFCGSGTLLMESLLQRRPIFGSDASEVMTRHTEANVGWMLTKATFERSMDVPYDIYVEDVTQMRHVPRIQGRMVCSIVTEGYLGMNFRGAHPTREEANREEIEVTRIWCEFFKFLDGQNVNMEIVATFPIHILDTGKYLRCRDIQGIAEEYGFTLLPLLPKKFPIEKSLRGSYTEEGTILYVRGTQFVGREIMKFRRVKK